MTAAGTLPATPTTRPAGPEDDGLLFDLYRSERSDVASFGWAGEAIGEFLAFQFRAREQSYRQQYPSADSRVVVVDGAPVGRLLVERRAGAVHLVDIAVLPSRRGQGIGSAVLGALLAEAATGGDRLTLSVLADNPARHL